jgi:polyhydroxyalkanoate synthase subunit PhaC
MAVPPRARAPRAQTASEAPSRATAGGRATGARPTQAAPAKPASAKPVPAKKPVARKAAAPKAQANPAEAQAKAQAQAEAEASAEPRNTASAFGAGLPNPADMISRMQQLFGASGAADAMSAAPALSALQPMAKAAEAMGQSMGATLQSLVGLTIAPDQLKGIQQDYLQQATALWNQTLSQPAEVKLSDKRFASPEWSKQPGSAFMAAMYLLNARTLQRLADNLQGDDKARQRVRFAVQQWADAAAPSNFLAFNPEALAKAVATKGESITQGLQHLFHDIRQGHMSQTDESVFEVGVNVATTAGSVVFENPYFQLIEYAPLTPKVHATPFLFVPPCINKYYILDLQPDNSLVRYLLSQGHRVFMVSWVNADDDLAQSTWDDYVEHGVVKAIDVTREVTGQDQVNALGFCVGGTLIATALATLAVQGRKPVKSLTLLTAFLDFVNTGTMDVFVDEAMVRMREMSIGPNSPSQGGLMRGGELATTFSFLRANDLVWNYVIGNYLKGEMPPAFDLLYWNSDSTNLPGPMYTWYLRNTYLENKLCQPGAVSVCGVPLDMRRLDMPTFIYGSREDHIVPWDSAYASTQVVSGPTTFVLGASGHIAGVINPPEKKKRSHWTNQARRLPATGQQWMETAQEHPGSWWPVWAEWLASHAGSMVSAPRQPGSKQYPVIEAAPGRYVKRKA